MSIVVRRGSVTDWIPLVPAAGQTRKNEGEDFTPTTTTNNTNTTIGKAPSMKIGSNSNIRLTHDFLLRIEKHDSPKSKTLLLVVSKDFVNSCVLVWTASP